MKKKLFCILLTVCMAVGLIPTSAVPVFADTATTYDVWVGGVQVDDLNKSDILPNEQGTASYDSTTKTLTLENVDIQTADEIYTSAVYSKEDLTIELVGANTVDVSDQLFSYGIYIYDFGGSLTFTGTGSLYMTASSQVSSSTALNVNHPCISGSTTAKADIASLQPVTIYSNQAFYIGMTQAKTVLLQQHQAADGKCIACKQHICGDALFDKVLTSQGGELYVDGTKISPAGGVTELSQGNYYLTGDIQCNTPIQIIGEVNLCLAGYTLDLSGYAFRACTHDATTADDFTLYDHTGNGKLVCDIFQLSKGTCTIAGGTVSSSGAIIVPQEADLYLSGNSGIENTGNQADIQIPSISKKLHASDEAGKPYTGSDVITIAVADDIFTLGEVLVYGVNDANERKFTLQSDQYYLVRGTEGNADNLVISDQPPKDPQPVKPYQPPFEIVYRNDNFETATGEFGDIAYYGRAVREGDIVTLKAALSEQGKGFGLDFTKITVEYEVEGAVQLTGNYLYTGDPVYVDGVATDFKLGKGFNKIVAHLYYNGFEAGVCEPFYAWVSE